LYNAVYQEVAVKLYTFPGAPNPRRVHVYLAEKGLEIPTETVDIFKRTNREPDFLAKNPFGGLPVLELDDGSHIAESVAICRYLEALHPTPPLFGRNAKEQGVVDMWIRRIELGFGMQAGMVWIHGSPLTKAVVKNQIPEMAEAARAGAHNSFALLDSALGERPFFAGDAYTMADVVALSMFDFASEFIALSPAPDAKNLARWHASVSSRPSAAAGRRS
jgi:glutathione S-transferase